MIIKQKILIVDDDTNISELVSLYLTKEHFETLCAEDGYEALERFADFQPDLILLDLMLPGLDGYEICKEIRKTSNVPIIMVSAKGEVFDKVLGLELGADDYIIKPFDPKELVARVKAILRRVKAPITPLSNTSNSQPASPAAEHIIPNGNVVSYPGLIVSLDNYSVTCDGQVVEMPPKELELFYFLASHPNHVFTREQLLDHIWGYEYAGDTRTVDVHIKRLREKIKDHDQWKLGTVWGIGYKFELKKV